MRELERAELAAGVAMHQGLAAKRLGFVAPVPDLSGQGQSIREVVESLVESSQRMQGLTQPAARDCLAKRSNRNRERGRSTEAGATPATGTVAA